MDIMFAPYLDRESAAAWITDRLRPSSVLTLNRGGIFPHASFEATMRDAGFVRADAVSAEGEFALGEDVVDIFPFGADTPFRLLLFGEEIQAIASYDPDTQLPLEDGDFLELNRKGGGGGGIDISVVYHVTVMERLLLEGGLPYLRMPASVVPGLVSGGSALIGAALFLRGAEPAARAAEGDGDRFRNRLEDYLEDWAKAAGFWVKDPEGFAMSRGRAIAEGPRSLVFRDPAEGGVVKVTALRRPLPEEIDRIAVFNSAFPSGRLAVHGFGRNRRGEMCAVVRQAYICGEQASVEEIRTMARTAGLRRLTDRDADGYGNADVILTGLFDEGNAVRTARGEILAVSCGGGLNTAGLRLGGRWSIHEAERDAKAVEEIGRILAGLVPEAVDRQSFVGCHETKTNMLSSQLEVTGRYDGYFNEPDPETEDTYQVAVQNDPLRRDRILVMNCRNISVLMDGYDGFPKKERDEMCYGFGMWIDGRFMAFDISKGRPTEALPFLDTLRRDLARQESEKIAQGLKRDENEEKVMRTKGRKRG